MLQWIFEPTTYILICTTVWVIYTGCKRSHQFHSEHHEATEQLDNIPKSFYLIAPLISSVSLLLLFYYMKEIYFILNFMVSFLSLISIAYVIYPTLEYLPIGNILTKPIKTYKIDNDKIIINGSLILSLIIGLIGVLLWRITNHSVIVNLLSISIAITSLTFLRINSLLTITLLLTAFLVYDVFWVFTSKQIFGESVMESVADKVVNLPLLITLPLFLSEGRTGLGNGDIVLPGVFICQLYFLDKYHGFMTNTGTPFIMRWKNGRISYFKLSLVLYVIGMFVTYIALSISKQGQPALLYLVPVVTYTTLAIAYLRGQLPLLMKPIPSCTNNGIIPRVMPVEEPTQVY